MTITARELALISALEKCESAIGEIELATTPKWRSEALSSADLLSTASNAADDALKAYSTTERVAAEIREGQFNRLAPTPTQGQDP